MRNPYNIYKGQDILKLSEDKSEPLVQDFLFENDYAILIAQDKVGKTILAQQLACSLSSGEPFLDTLEVPKPVRVWYFASEGKDEDIKDRFIRMGNAIPINVDNITLICSPGFRFNTKQGEQWLIDILEKYKDELPKVIIIDPLYKTVKGSLRNDEIINDFQHIIGKLAYACDAAVFLVHHMTKPQRNQEGQYVDRTDDDIFGSAFIKAAVDHCFWLEWCKKDPNQDKSTRHRILKCNTQRSGNIIDNVRLELVEPDPLFFKMVSTFKEEKHKVVMVMANNKEGMDIRDLMKKTRIKRATLYKVLKELIQEKKVNKIGSKVKRYLLTETS